MPAAHSEVAEWTHDQLSDDELAYLRRLPAERRMRVGDLLVLVCHGSPGSQTDGLPVDLDPSVTIQRITRTDARAIACGHTHVAEVRDFGRRLIVIRAPAVRLRRRCRRRLGDTHDRRRCALRRADARGLRPVPTADEISAGGLAGDVYRAAVRTGSSCGDDDERSPAGGHHRHGAVTPLGNDPATFWSRLVAGESGVRTIGGFDPRG